MQIMPNRYPIEQRARPAWLLIDSMNAARRGLLAKRSGPSSEELAEIKQLKRENAELREANEILRTASISSPGNSTLATVDLRAYCRAARPRARGRAPPVC
jgi:transposase-like protein